MQNSTNLKEIEEETKEKVAAVNSEKVTITKAFIASIKVGKRWLASPQTRTTAPFTFLLWTPASLSSAAEDQADDGEGAPDSGDRGVGGREDKAGERFPRRRRCAQNHGCEGWRTQSAVLLDRAGVTCVCVCVCLQQKCNQLEQRKVQLTIQCKEQQKKAMSICKMQAKDDLPEDLRNVSVHHITL